MTIKAIKLQIIITLMLLMLTLWLFDITNLDMAFQTLFYKSQLHHWVLDKHDIFFKYIFYVGIKYALILLFLSIFIIRLLARHTQVIEDYKKPITILLLSALLIPMIIDILKIVTNIPCPRDLEYFGGTSMYYKLFDFDSRSQKNFACFPAAHAGVGFILLAFVFFFKKKKHQCLFFVFALMIGWSMGFYKIAIGHHFLSHTIVSMLIAWLIILIISYGVFYGFRQTDQSHGEVTLATKVGR